MGVQSIRLGSTLVFDSEKEKDIISIIEKLNSCHKTGQFISSLIRIAFDCPEILKKANNTVTMGDILRQIEQNGIQKDRAEFFDGLTKQSNELKQKVDSIYNMTVKMYTLALMRKQLGLEENSKNTLMASFILEQQLTELQNVLGINLDTFESNKITKVEDKAKECLEYIINTYGDIVDELRGNISVPMIAVPVTNTAQAEQVTKTDVNTEIKAEKEAVVNNNVQLNEVITDTGESGEDIIDFGSDALSNFFGD